jgi:hypothetical protein
MVSRCGFTLGLLFASLLTSFAWGEPLRYRWASDSQLVYDVEITADTPDAIETLTGKIIYKVKSAEEPFKVTYQGGLKKASQKKPGASSDQPRGPFGNAFGPPPGFGNPFARNVNPFKGLEQTNNEIVVSSKGNILAMEGSSQLPYLLGNLSLMVFEPLSDMEQPSWKVESGVSITEKREGGRGPGGFNDPFNPFAQRPGAEKTTAAGETTAFTKERDQGDLTSFTRTYRLNSPGDGVSLTIDGTGRWTFNRKLGMSESLDFKQILKISKEGVSITVPVSIKYRRLSNEEYAQMEAERIEAARSRTEKEALDAAIAKALTGAPSGSAEREKIVQAATAQFKQDVTNAYNSANQATVLGLWVTYDTPLPKGLIVAANSYSRGYSSGGETAYFPGEIDSVLETGLVRVRYSHIGGATEERLREDIFIAPEVVDQKALSPTQLEELRSYRERVKQELASAPDGPKATEKVIRSYRDNPQPLTKTGDPVPADLALPKYMVVAAKKKDGQWYQAHISSVQPDGSVLLRFSSQHADDKVARSDLRLPPPEVRSPNQPPSYKEAPYPSSPTAPATAQFRTWSDATGKFKVEAKFLSADSSGVQIERKDGKKLTIPLERLSAADQQFVAAQRKSENPFE